MPADRVRNPVGRRSDVAEITNRHGQPMEWAAGCAGRAVGTASGGATTLIRIESSKLSNKDVESHVLVPSGAPIALWLGRQLLPDKPKPPDQLDRVVVNLPPGKGSEFLGRMHEALEVEQGEGQGIVFHQVGKRGGMPRHFSTAAAISIGSWPRLLNAGDLMIKDYGVQNSARDVETA